MKTVFLILLVSLMGCAADGELEATTSSKVSSDPYHWMVGTWACTTDYSPVPEAGLLDPPYQIKGTYTAVETADGGVAGQYREDGITHAAINWDDTWRTDLSEEVKMTFATGYYALTYTRNSTPDSALWFMASGNGGNHNAQTTNKGSSFVGHAAGTDTTAAMTLAFAAPRIMSITAGVAPPFSGPDTVTPHLSMDVELQGVSKNTGKPVLRQHSFSDCAFVE